MHKLYKTIGAWKSDAIWPLEHYKGYKRDFGRMMRRKDKQLIHKERYEKDSRLIEECSRETKKEGDQETI